jgi:hypothetical protein
MMAGSESADDCSGWLVAGYYWDGDSVEQCLEDSYCQGGAKINRASSDAQGTVECPPGTNSAVESDDISDCNTLKAGYWYDGPGPISTATINSCKEGFYCDTENKAISVPDDTSEAEGLMLCPDGTSSPAGAKEINDCKILLAGFEYTPTTTPSAIAAIDVKPCAADTYFADEREIDTATFAALPCLQCPEGTGVNAAEPGAKFVNDCTKVYEGYYYNAIIPGDISTTTVRPCPANKFCPGRPLAENTIELGTPMVPTSCPPGTKVVAGNVLGATNWWTDNTDARAISTPTAPADTTRSGVDGARTVADCDTLVAGWWYDGPGDISTTTVKQCPVDKYCDTEDVAIDPVLTDDTDTGSPGIKYCPTGSGSALGSNDVNDCNQLKPGYYFAGNGNVVGSTILQCPVKSYW